MRSTLHPITFLTLTLFCMIMFLFTPLFIVSAHDGGLEGHHDTTDYVSLSPLPGTESVDASDPSSYFSTLFTIFISVISILAVIKLMLCGFQYMTSEAVSSKENAKKCIWAVIFGIFLILLSFLILKTINPELVKLQFDAIKTGLTPSGPSVVFPPGFTSPPPTPPPGSGWCYLYGTPSPACFSTAASCNLVRSSDATRTDITERCVEYP